MPHQIQRYGSSFYRAGIYKRLIILYNINQEGDFIGEKDIISRTLESYNDVFADIINVFLFGGEQVIKPEELSCVNLLTGLKQEGK